MYDILKKTTRSDLSIDESIGCSFFNSRADMTLGGAGGGDVDSGEVQLTFDNIISPMQISGK